MSDNEIINWYKDNRESTLKNLKAAPTSSPSQEEKIFENEKLMRNDSIVWKHFSKTGGIYDTLKKLESAVEKPAINAFDFDEEENTYMIFITVTNSILYLFKEFCVSMNKELDSETDESIETEWKELNGKYKALEKNLDEFETFKGKIDKELSKYESAMSEDTSKGKKDTMTLEYVMNVIKEYIKQFTCNNITISITLKTIKQELSKLQSEKKQNGKPTLNVEKLEYSLEQSISEFNNKYYIYKKQQEDYQKRKKIYDCKYEILKSYNTKYNSLRESIDGLYSSICEGGELYCLNNAPSKEDGTDDYMQAAKTLCEKAKEITKDYQF